MIIPNSLEELAGYVETGKEVYFSLLPPGAETAVLSNRKCLKSKNDFLIGNLLK